MAPQKGNKMKISERINKVAEAHNFYLGQYEDLREQDGEYYLEINQSTPEGEDWCETIWFDGTDKDFANQLLKRANDFDIDEETEPYIEMRGTRGVPSSIMALIKDAQWKKKQLKAFAKDFAKSIKEKTK